LNDKFGPRIVLTGSGFLFGFGFLLMSKISAIWQLYLLYGVFIAIGVSTAFVPLTSTVARWFIKRRGVMTGIVVAGVGIGTTIAPPLTNWLISSHGWRNCYIIVGAAVLIVIVCAAQFLRRDPSQMGLPPYGGRQITGQSLNMGTEGISFRGAIRTRQLWVLCAIYFCYYFTVSAVMVHVVIHAIGVGISPGKAAGILSIIGGGSIVSKIMMGGIADRVGNKKTIMICFVMLSIALFLLMITKGEMMFYLFAVILGLAYGGLATLMSPIVAELFGLRSHGTILGLVFAVDSIGGAISPVLSGRIFDLFGSYQIAFLICGLISIAGLVLNFFLTANNKRAMHKLA
jgi:MFS family permease